MTIRLADPQHDFEGILAVVNAFEETPVEHDVARRWFEYMPAGRIARRTVAVDDSGAVVGYGVIVHEAWQPDGAFYVWVGVLPEYRSQGYGHTLALDARAYLAQNHARHLRSEVRDDDAPSQVFARRAGFVQSCHLFSSSVDVVRFDAAPFRGARTGLEKAGIRFGSVADFGDTLAARKRLYELNTITGRDIPGKDGPAAPFEDFEKWICGSTWYRPEGQLLAIDGDRWVGLCSIQLLPETKRAYNVMTGVLREYRGCKIALALKVQGIEYARQHGAIALDTSNASTNAAMLAVNGKLGYVPRPGKYLLERVDGA